MSLTKLIFEFIIVVLRYNMKKTEIIVADKRIQIEYYDSVLSTNTLLKELNSSECGLIHAAIADTQSGGRGRLGKSFYCPSNCGLYMSFRLDGDLVFSYQYLTVVSAVAVVRAIYEIFGVKCDIKWVNDLYLNSKKVCGILCEGVFDNGAINSAIVGIGVNIAEPKGGYPKEIKDVAGALCQQYSDEIRDRLAKMILIKFFDVLKLDSQSLYHEYKDSLFIIGRTVTFIRNNIRTEATVEGLSSDFSLLVSHDGIVESLNSGEITIKT